MQQSYIAYLINFYLKFKNRLTVYSHAHNFT